MPCGILPPKAISTFLREVCQLMVSVSAMVYSVICHPVPSGRTLLTSIQREPSKAQVPV